MRRMTKAYPQNVLHLSTRKATLSALLGATHGSCGLDVLGAVVDEENILEVPRVLAHDLTDELRLHTVVSAEANAVLSKDVLLAKIWQQARRL